MRLVIRTYIYFLLVSLLLVGPAIAQDAITTPRQEAPDTENSAAPDIPREVLENEASRSGIEFFDTDDDGSVNLLEVFETIWYFPLYDGGGGEPVRLNRIFTALLLIVIGVWLSHRLTMLLRNRLTRLQRVNNQAAAVVQKLLFYLLVVVVALIVLPFLGIPTTIFTVLGGGLAIGVGFGAQNLIGNLISGIIIMAERPIRLGDIVMVDNEEGRIDEIGSRSTRIRRSDGIDVILPNSSFLEHSVINWTLSDRDVRCSVKVGVAYGSPTQETAKLIRQAVDENERTLAKPEPIVLFEEFGDNSLNFNVLFWTRVSVPMDRRRIESDVRYRIDELFREAGITIAFPQRDVHVDGLGPIEVRVTENAKSSKGQDTREDG